MHPDILTQIALAIVTATVFAFVAKFTRQPLILGYIAAGVAIGPTEGLGWITAARHRTDRRDRPHPAAVHDRPRDRPEEDAAGGARRGHGRRVAVPDLRRRSASLFAPLIGFPSRRRLVRGRLLRRRDGAVEHDDRREAALRQVGARHAAGPHHGRHPRLPGHLGDHRAGAAAEPARTRRRSGCSHRSAPGVAGRRALRCRQPLRAAALFRSSRRCRS